MHPPQELFTLEAELGFYLCDPGLTAGRWWLSFTGMLERKVLSRLSVSW